MKARALALAAGLGWVGYACGAHLLTPLCLSRARGAGRRVALTFDDGPDPVWTPRVLDVLTRHDVRGSFFLVGERAARAPDTVRAIAGGGHEVASHGWSHRSLWLCGPRGTEAEVGAAQDVLYQLTGRAPRWFRPPWGLLNASLFGALRRHGLRCVLWSLQPEGLRPAAAEEQAARVVRGARPGAIVDLHDAEGTPGAPARLVDALPAMIDGLRAAGFEFGTVGELVDAAAATAPPSASAGRPGSAGTRRPRPAGA